MKCNNKHCYWNMKGICVSENLEPTTEHKFQPDQLDCAMSVRWDYEGLFSSMYRYFEYLGVSREILNELTFKEMHKLHLTLKTNI